MKIALDISPALYGTGVSDYTTELARRLPVLQFGYSLRRRPELQRLFPAARVFPFPPTAMHYLWNKLHVFSVENLTGHVDVYHSSDWTQAPSSAKKVTAVHDLAPFLYPDETSHEIVAAHTARMKWVVKECDKIICVSQNTANDMSKLFPESFPRLIVIPEALPSRFLLHPTTHYSQPSLLAMGPRQPRKNIARLISACARLSKKLIIIGEHDSSFMPHDSVTFTGYISDQELVNYLAGAACFAYPSLYEGFGLPILGAFHHKAPVACSDIAVFHETAGSAAAYFDPLDEESIANSITEAIKNKKTLTAAGTKQLSKFSWSQTATETMKVYKSLC